MNTDGGELYALVMAGGRGTRFWPLSRSARPKQTLQLDEGGSLLRQTLDRLAPLIPPERTLIVTGRPMEDAVRAEAGNLPRQNILVEPSGRNTAPCIGWGAVEIGARGGGEAVMAVFPSDHRVDNPERFRQVVTAAAEAASNTNALVTLGIAPDRPETGYGYLQLGPEVGDWNDQTFHVVERFVEKPNAEMAQTYLNSGNYLWNAGMFVFTVDSLRDAFRAYLPGSAVALEELTHDRSRLNELWVQLDATSIDYGVMERSRHIVTVPCDIGWSDVGSWSALQDLGLGSAASYLVGRDSTGCVVHAPEHLVALVGVHDLVVAEADGVLLVMSKDHAQDLGLVVAELKSRGLERFT